MLIRILTGIVLIAIGLFGISVVVVFVVSSIMSAIGGAPFVPLRYRAVKKMLEYANLKPGEIFYDLGCGDGRIVILAAKKFKSSLASGYEISFWPFIWAKINIFIFGGKSKQQIKIFRKNMFKSNLSDADLVYVYLFPELMDKLGPKFEAELKKGARIISPTFSFSSGKFSSLRLIKEEKIDRITAYLYEKI